MIRLTVGLFIAIAATSSASAQSCAGNPVAVWDWENERVAIIPPEEIVVPEEEEIVDLVGSQDRTRE